MEILIKNGRVIDPASKIDEVKDILINKGNIEQVADNIDRNVEKVIDASGKWVVPGLIDMHTHLREPGFEYKETIATGSQAAAKGGFTTICCMPNTNPVIDNEILVEYIKLKAEKEAVVHVIPIGSITKGQKGKELANIGKMSEKGICAISEDGKTVEDVGLLKKAMKYAKMWNLPILSHCEEPKLAGGAMNAGVTSEIIGMKGIPNDSEEVIVARDMIVAKSVGAKLHICHISTRGSVDIMRWAKQQGQDVTAEVCPHHFALTEEVVDGYDTNTKMSPPLRTQDDVDCILKALKDNVIEVIATDHAPHHYDEKNYEYEKAPFGIVGLETALPLGITCLVETGVLTPTQLIEKMSTNPAKLLGLDKGTLKEGSMADVTIIDPLEVYQIDVNNFVSKSTNTPFGGWKVKGKVVCTIVNGKIVI